MIPCPQQPPTRIGKTVSGANAVLSSLAPPAALAAGQRIVFRCRRVSLCDLYATARQIFQRCY